MGDKVEADESLSGLLEITEAEEGRVIGMNSSGGTIGTPGDTPKEDSRIGGELETEAGKL